MANKPELSIKVSVDPVIDSEKLENDVQAQVSNIKNLPPVPIEPDTSGFKRAIEENIGGPYSIEITPTLTKNLAQQVNDEITAAQNGAQQLKVKLDVKEFGNELSKQLKEQLRGVNRTLSNYLKEMQVNLALANKATYGLFSGGNRNVPVDSIFDEISKKDVKAVQTLTSQLDKVFEGLPKLKSAGKIDFENEIGSVEEFSSALSKMGTALQNMQAALNIYDQKQAKAAYSSAFDEFKKNYINVQGISDVLNGIVNNSSALKNLDIKGSAQLKNFLVSLTDGITAVSSVKDIDVNNFDNLISVLDPDKFGELATNISEVTSQISISTGESKKKLEELKKAEEEAMGAGVPIDPSILDANTKKIIESIGNVSAAMTELETKSKNFSNNLTVEVDKNVSNIESRIKQLTGLVKILPNGEENLLEGEKPKNKPAKPKKQNDDTKPKSEDKSENASNGSTATINKITFDVDIEKLQEAVDVLFAKISAPIGFKPAEGAVAAVKKTLEESLNGVEILNAIASKQTDNKDTDNSAQSIPVKGHITITDTDVSSDVKNPIDIPVKATLKKKDIIVPKTPVEIKVKAEITDATIKAAAENPKKKSKKKVAPAADEAEQLSFDSPELVVQKEEQKPIELPLPETPNYTKPSETLDDYRDSVGAAANIQQYFASEVDNATASLGSQSETLKALKKSLDEYTGSIDGVEKFAKAEKELDRLKKKLAQQPQQQPAQPTPQKPNNQPPAPIKPNNNPKPNNNGQPPAPPTPPNNQPPNKGGINGGGNNPPVESQQKLEQALERIMTKMITAENKKDTSGDKGYGKNVAEQVKWQGQLHDRAEELIDKLNANYSGWEKGKSWQRHGENIAHVREDYSTAREDKQDLDTVQKLGNELQRNLKLREDLHKIDKNVEPVKYQNTQDDIKKSKAEIARLRSEAKAKGLNTNEVTSDFLKKAAELQEQLTNKGTAQAKKENTKLLTDYNNQLQTTLDILRDIQTIDQNQSPVKYADAQRRLVESKAKTARLGNDIKGKKLTGSADFIKANTEYVAGYKNLQEDIKNKEADAALKDQTKTLKENTDLLVKYDQELTKQFNLYKDLKKVNPNNAPDQAAKQLAFNNQKAKVDNLKKQIAQKGLHTDPAYIQRNNQYTMDVAGFDRGQNIQIDKTTNAEAIKAINTAKNKYLDAYDAVQKKREELSKIDDAATKQMIQNAIAVQRGIMKSAGNEINSYGKNYGNLVSDTWNEISIHRNDSQIKSQSAYETKANKEAAATKKENINLLKQYNQSLNEELKLLKQVYAAETVEGKAAAQNALNDQKDKTENLRKQLKGKGLDTTSDYQKYNTQNALNEAAINARYNGTSIEDLKNTYIKNLREREANINAAYSTEDADKIARITQRIEDNNKAIQEAGFALTQFGQKADNAWAEISKVNDELDIAAEQKFNRALELQTKQTDAQAKKAISDNEKLLNRIERAMRNQEKAYSDYQSSEDNTQDKETKLGRLNIRNEELKGLRQQAGTRGLTVTPEYLTLEKQHREEILGIDEALQKRAEAEREAIRVQDEDRISLLNYIKTVEKYKDRLEQDNHTDDAVYGDSVKMANAGWDLLSELNKNPNDKNQVAYLWGQKYGIQGVTDLESAFKALAVEAGKAGIKVQDLRTETEKFRSVTQAKTNIANLQSQLMDYLEKFPKVEKGLAEPVQKLKAALADSNAYKNAGQLKQAMAELRAQAKSLGLESENLIDKFQKLFGQHLSTMITMAALHKMQDALRIVYQNVVEIDTALIELRKVSELSGKSLEEYMGRAAEQAQNLGVSISDYIGSTADWKRLGYSDEDAENMATYSTLLKNVGDGIDDVNTSSSYLISTLQGFGLLAKDAESVVDQIDKIANTQPITAQAIGEILTRSAASMKAANNDLAETISLGTAAYAVIQNAETVGTTLKSVSMYLRAAKSELEDAGESADGCANSVSELRSELKSLTGVDIMIDNKNFKSTYQILKELSQVWGNLSDVTQANVTEMIGGKRNANAVSALLNNFEVAESSLEAAANSAGTAWAENDVWMDSIQARLAQLDASFQALSEDVLSSDLVKGGVSFLTSIIKLLDKIVNLTGALPLGLGIGAFAGQLGKPKMTGFMIVPSNTPGGDTEQARCSSYWRSAAREYLVKPTNMVA